MKPKNLRKKIQRLEKRLQEGPKKLAKLKQKLQAAEAAKKLKASRKSASRAARAAAKPSKAIEKKAPAQAAAAKKSGAGKKVKKKLNLSPERRAQLAAAMKARWAAKRAAEAQTKAGSGDNQHSAPPGPSPQAPENRPDGV
jgi:cell division septum initiation protein DivIVA